MADEAREKRSQRLFLVLILGLLVGYAVLKYGHIVTALEAYKGQPLNVDTSGAAK